LVIPEVAPKIISTLFALDEYEDVNMFSDFRPAEVPNPKIPKEIKENQILEQSDSLSSESVTASIPQSQPGYAPALPAHPGQNQSFLGGSNHNVDMVTSNIELKGAETGIELPKPEAEGPADTQSKVFDRNSIMKRLDSVVGKDENFFCSAH